MEKSKEITKKTSEMKRHELSLCWRRKLCYGVGHILNDLCANVWFSYLIIYMQFVVQLSATSAGFLLLMGQIADGIATPLVGIESDRTRPIKYGRRKLWHLIGVCCVSISFPFIYIKCFGCTRNSEDYAKVIYYVPFIVIFQFGWATTQIAHLSLIPELSECEVEKVTLNALRYAGTVSSGIVVYLVFWYLIKTMNSNDSFGPEDHSEFMYLALITIAIGLLFMVIFHVGVKEKPRECVKLGCQKNRRNACNWKLWFHEPEFYKIAVLYMCSRLIVNISQVYTPQFTKRTLHNQKEIVAIVPLIVFVSGFFTTIAAKHLNVFVGQKTTYIFGMLAIIGNCSWVFVMQRSTSEVYGYAILLGFGGSLSLVTCLGMLASLIGENKETGAFVYGAMSFVDKLSNGIVVQIIQSFHSTAHEKSFYRYVIMFVPGGAAILGLMVALMLKSRMEPLIPKRSHHANGFIHKDESREGLLTGIADSIQNHNYGSHCSSEDKSLIRAFLKA